MIYERNSVYSGGVELAHQLKQAGFGSNLFEMHISNNNDLFEVVNTHIKVEIPRKINAWKFSRLYGNIVFCDDFREFMKKIPKRISIGAGRKQLLSMSSQDLKRDANDGEIISYIKAFSFPEVLFLVNEFLSGNPDELKLDGSFNAFYCKSKNVEEKPFTIIVGLLNGFRNEKELHFGKCSLNEYKHKKNSRIFSSGKDYL